MKVCADSSKGLDDPAIATGDWCGGVVSCLNMVDRVGPCPGRKSRGPALLRRGGPGALVNGVALYWLIRLALSAKGLSGSGRMSEQKEGEDIGEDEEARGEEWAG